MSIARPMPFLTLAVGLAVAGCPKRGPAAGDAAPAAGASTATSAAAGHGHDPANPPIDCPLRKRGVEPAHMRPFKEVAEYITFLDRPERAEWQKPDAVIAALDLQGAETVYDLGAGSGYFSFRFAAALPRGRVVAGDVEAEMVRHVHHRAMTQGVKNIEAALIPPNDPAVPPDTDVVFLCDVLHHVVDRPVWLGKLAAQMKAGARLALIEFKEGKLPHGPPEAMKIPRAELVELVTKAGLSLASEQADLLPYQVFLVFTKQ